MRASVFSILPGNDHAAVAADYIAHHITPPDRAKTLLLVPNRRSALLLNRAFTAKARGKTVYLPRIVPFSELHAALPTLLSKAYWPALAAIPPIMDGRRRLWLLATQIQLFMRARYGAVSVEQALRLAQDLAELQDQCIRADSELSIETLKKLADDEFAEHWQHAQSFLHIVAEHWQAIEQETGSIIAEAHQQRALSLLMKAWQESPPNYPVFVVGSTASQPRTAELMALIASFVKGGVILPAYDPQATADAMPEGHPYFYMHAFLARANVAPQNVMLLGDRNSRADIWHYLSRSSSEWKSNHTTHTDHLKLIPCRHGEEEAKVIALLLREVADDTSRTAALVTPDEGLMARVAIQLLRHGITIDRTAHGRLADTATGVLLRHIVQVIEHPESVTDLVILLQHPLVKIGDKEAWEHWKSDFANFAREVSYHPFAHTQLEHSSDCDAAISASVRMVWNELLQLARTPRLLASLWAERFQSLLHRLTAERGEGKEAIEALWPQFESANTLGPLDAAGIRAVLTNYLDEPWRRPELQAHPRLYMLTPVEARLMRFDRMILGNMQQRFWPGLHTPSPWLNARQRAALGLPGEEARASLAAHDVLSLGSAREVFFTYPERECGAAATRAPIIEKLLSYLTIHGIDEATATARDYLRIARALDAAPRYMPITPPMPMPTCLQRPHTLRVTALDKLTSDPYALYAEYILMLRPLDEFDAPLESKDFGILAHRAIEALSQHWLNTQSPADVRIIGTIADQALASFAARPHIALFWRTRLIKALAFVNEQETLRRNVSLRVETEIALTECVALSENCAITLHGRIDRLETDTATQALRIIDYKTGRTPTLKQIERGEAAQLIAYALMLSEKGRSVNALEYWSLPRSTEPGEIVTFAQDFITPLLPRLKALLADFWEESTPLLARPSATQNRFENEYDGISRYDEWAG